MGLGDWIMATAQVRELNERTGRRVVVVDRMGRARWSEAFDNNPRIMAPAMIQTNGTQDFVRLLNAGGARPYIRDKTPTHWLWKSWPIKPGELYMTDDEMRFAWERMSRQAVLIEPNTKVPGSNKAWPFDRWQDVVYAMPEIEFVQAGPSGAQRLSGVRFIETTTRQAFALVASARLFVGTEGALHHAAAALGKSAVVLWSEFIAPQFTGYPSQRNIRKTQNVCGSRHPCQTCRDSMLAIGVEEVVEAISEELGK